MADNTSIDPGASPTVTIATDEISGIHYQKVKLYNATTDSTDPVLEGHRFGASSERIPFVALMAYEYRQIDALVESGSTSTVINCTGHSAVVGAVVSFAYWASTPSAVSYVTAVTANTITVSPPLPAAPTNGDKFDILQGKPVPIEPGVGALRVVTTSSSTVKLTSNVVSSSVTVASVGDTTSSTTLKASNALRKRITITNDSTARLYILLGSGTASSTNYTISLGRYDTYEDTMYTGNITGVWDSDPNTGNALITEVT